jgi:hypothetical protein
MKKTNNLDEKIKGKKKNPTYIQIYDLFKDKKEAEVEYNPKGWPHGRTHETVGCITHLILGSKFDSDTSSWD